MDQTYSSLRESQARLMNRYRQEIDIRLHLLSTCTERYSVEEFCAELDHLKNLLVKIKRAGLFLKNTEWAK